jgi:hypothetical protein
MAKDRKIVIDLNVYCTQADYAKDNDKKLSTVSQWVKRAKAGQSNLIDYLEIPELNNLTLVKRRS